MAIFPHSQDRIYEMFDAAVQHECRWTNHIVGNNILGITEHSTEQYTKYLANIRLRSIGLESLYSDPKYQKSPYTHLERFSDTKKEAHTKANFFEASVTSYVMSSGVSGWDEIWGLPTTKLLATQPRQEETITNLLPVLISTVSLWRGIATMSNNTECFRPI